MKIIQPFFFCFLSTVNLLAQSSAVSAESEREKILVLHRAQRAVHFEKNAAGFAALLADPHYSINRGNVRRAGRAETQARFGNYFNSVDFLQWDDTSEPIVHLSADGTMAYTVVEKAVKVRYPSAEGDTLEEFTQFAWVAIYEKTADGWKITCNASTNRPPVIRSATGDPGAAVEVLRAVETFSRAFAAADTNALSGLLTRQYVHTNGSSAPLQKTQWLQYVGARNAEIKSGALVLREYRNEDLIVETYSDQTAIVQGVNTASGERNGQPFRTRIRFTQVWVQENGRWKRAAFHDGRID
jgi:Domain of unknown function (DUF4440)